jgi:hypothetical protein
VEVWREENNSDGIDCTATDGPSPALFTRGTMTWSNLVVQTTSSTASNLTLAGRVTGVDGKRYQYSINYRLRGHWLRVRSTRHEGSPVDRVDLEWTSLCATVRLYLQACAAAGRHSERPS